MEYKKTDPISLKEIGHKEKWLQDEIIEDPEILGLGDIQYVGRERIHSDGGKLDLLFESADMETRYVVEVQCGECDPSHIFRLINYWNNERKKRPSKKYCAVLVAEKIIDSRYGNLLHLFDPKIQIKAIQLNIGQIKDEDTIIMSFTKVIDTKEKEIEDEKEKEIVDRNFWETKRSTPDNLILLDKMEKILKEMSPDIKNLNYTKSSFIDLVRDNKIANLIRFRPLKRVFYVYVTKENIAHSTINFVNDSGLVVKDRDNWDHYEIAIPKQLSDAQTEALKMLFKEAVEDERDVFKEAS